MAHINENDVAYGVLSVGTDEIPDRAITEPKLADDAVSTRTIQQGAVNSTKLDSDVLEMFDAKLDYQKITNVDGSPVNLNYLNVHSFTPFKFYYLYKGTDIIPDVNTNEYALFFPLTALSQIIILANGVMYARQRESTAAEWSAFAKTTASIESDISTLKYNAAQAQAAIIRLNGAVNELIGKSTLSVGFDSNGIAVKVSPSTSISAGDFLTNVTTVYMSPAVTEVTTGFAMTAPNVTDIYIDNTEGNVRIDAYVLTVINVHYKNDFNFSNMILNSIVNSNTKIADLDARITALES